MKRSLVVLGCAALVASALGAPAWAKGPGAFGPGGGGGSASISGPGLGGGPIRLDGARFEKFFGLIGPGVDGLFYQYRGMISPPRPARSKLGPRYTVTYQLHLMSSAHQRVTESVRQFLYPYAEDPVLHEPMPWAYTPRGQRFSFDGHRYSVSWGWGHSFLLFHFLRASGFPKAAPAVAASSGTSAAAAGSSGSARVWIAVGALALLLVGGALVARPRRARLPA